MQNKKKNTENLFELLQKLQDHRRKQGLMYTLPLVLLIVIMGIMNGAKSERAISRFAENNKDDLIKYLQIKKKRIPTRNIIRGILQTIDFYKLTKIFHEWTKDYVEIKEKDWISIDGKAIKGTVQNLQNTKQNFKSIVSVFASKRKQIISASKLETKKTNEIPVVQKLIGELDLKGVVFTLDALHCQKKTVKKVIDSKNDYIIGVKGNQKKLLTQIKKTL
jgi:hypothetical protein